MTELRIRVKPIIKEQLEEIKKKTGLSISFQTNFALFKYLVLDIKVPYWKLDTRPDPHYEVINKLPEDLKFCDGDRCELPFVEKSVDGCVVSQRVSEPLKKSNISTDSKPRGDKC